ncbi:sigma-70 family RNA polymerase sigma factor [Pelistega europaea]|uniref:Sigma-70 family RNA polymerase sigma factor n=1 Tax=Pelistega europaea TaxID=106147 RepID=A0A7Y4LB17_9BURK|nr:sigma-70 family RNA polymerase sigma factor [Pelistega europaea]NOL50238.1 sigma-70 family RNA polymerase sigma factor [Pelistega europaea]
MNTPFVEQLNELYPYMLRFAQVQLRDDSLAEDMVQEALTAAWNKREQFNAQSTLKTWMLSILKNKIADYFRKTPVLMDLDILKEKNDDLDITHDNYFDETGHWKEGFKPQEWHQIPEQYMQNQLFFRALEECLARLPEDTARVFYLREVDGWETEEICQQFNLSKDNCYVMLHRARNALRRCLQRNWFNEH